MSGRLAGHAGEAGGVLNQEGDVQAHEARRACRRGDRLLRGDHRRLQRPREGHRHGQADGHAVRHVREAGPARVRPRPRPALPGSRVQLGARLSDEIAREIDDEIRRMVEEAHQSARGILEQHREKLDTTSDILLRSETIEREQFIELLEGRPEHEEFGAATPSPRRPTRRVRRRQGAVRPGSPRSEGQPAPVRTPA